MELTLATSDGQTKSLTVNDKVYGTEFNESLIHQVITAHLARERSGTHAQKTRSEVRGGGAKPWRQKGTGRARAGSIRSPIWRGGGVTFASKPRDYEQKVNKKMYRGAMRSILSELNRQNRILFLDDFSVETHKTKDILKQLAALDFHKGLIVVDKLDEKLYLAVRNIVGLSAQEMVSIDPVRLVGAAKIIMTLPVVKYFEEYLA